MEFLMLIFCVIPAAVTAITISPNGNSPDIKMIGGMMVDVQQGFTPMMGHETATKSNYDKSRKLNVASTKLSINERYRRLIPYMTFYYANDLTSTTEAYNTRNVEVEKAEIVEQKTIEQSTQRQPKIIYSSQRDIPRYLGNRLTQFNIASANPTKVYYKEGVPVYQNSAKEYQQYNPVLPEHLTSNDNFEPGRLIQKQNIKTNTPYSTRKPFLYHDDAGVQYYLGEKDQAPKYKLVPYEQTPVKLIPPRENIYVTNRPAPVPVLIPKEPVYIKPRPGRPQYVYDTGNTQQLVNRKQPVVVSESYYEKRPHSLTRPVVESGFKPIVSSVIATERPIFDIAPNSQFNTEKPSVQVVEPAVAPEVNYRPNYYQYVVEQPAYKPEPHVGPVTLADLLNSLQLNKSIPKPITRENVGSSIRTLLQVLNTLKVLQQNEVEAPILSTPRPFIAPEVAVVDETPKQEIIKTTTAPAIDATDLQEEPYLAHVNIPSQHLDDFSSSGGTSQRFPLPVQSDEEGGTPGRPGVDYPILTTIPATRFDCKTQRYKGFFADPETRCQVWHYCDLNGGQASFLCPNGTIFSQAGLTCDWWFNVRCAATTQLYVLNESLYKYILPHSPKFPEDYSGPLVDKYLTLKFKEMEEQFKKNRKNKQSVKEKMDSDENEDTTEGSAETVTDTDDVIEDSDLKSVSEASVVVDSPGTSGNVERLQD